MRTFFLTFCCLGLLLTGCKKSETPTPATPPTPAKTVNDIKLTVSQPTMPLSTFDIGNYSFQSVMVGNSIYFGNYSNSGKPQFFVRYDLGSNTFSSPLAKSSNVCACGYMSKLVTDGNTIFYIANDATKYTPSSNTWANLNYPATAKNNGGEAGIAYYNGKVYFVGGRTPSNVFKYYAISQDSWFTAPNYLYATSESEVAVYKDRLYVLGGEGAEKKMAFFSTASNTWTALKDLPFNLNTSYQTIYSAVLGDNLFVLQGSKVYVYDLVKDEWAANPIAVSGMPSYGSLFSNGQKLYVAGKNSSNLPTLSVLDVTQ